MFDFNLSFGCAVLVTTTLTLASWTAPNKNKRDGWKRDRNAIYAGDLFLGCWRIVIGAVGSYHAAMGMTNPNSRGSICRYPENLNESLFQWDFLTLLCVLLICGVGAPLRLISYAGLGTDFTFKLAAPEELQTTGIYGYVQHPSYAGLMIVYWAYNAMMIRWDGVLGCYVPPGIIESLHGWGLLLNCLMITFMVHQTMKRVRDEEDMLKDLFGKKWEVWHKSTSRFIPGLM